MAKIRYRAGDTALDVLPENLSLVPSIHSRGLTTVHSSSSKGSDTSGLCRYLYSQAHTHKHTLSHTTRNNINKSVKKIKYRYTVFMNEIDTE